MKKKIALLIGASIYNQKGLFNAAHERAKHLIEVSDAQIDLYLISTYKAGIGRLLSREKEIARPENFTKDGLTYRIIWLKNTLVDYILVHKLKKCRYSATSEFKRYLPLFKDYELIEGHTTGSFVWQIYKTFGTPYTITWHGTDIHTTPFLSKDHLHETKLLIEYAAHNFFVSEALLETSGRITEKGQKSVSYNGRDISFVCFPTEEKQKIKEKFAVTGKKVVAFVGNLIPVKNIKTLPDIFHNIYRQEKNIEFWVLGKGPLMNSLVTNTSDLPIRLWGNVEHEKMIDFMNVMDVLILPSLNEGLPLVTVEALSCGCHVVGSKVGGIPESIGAENTVSLDDPEFAEKIACHAIELMKSDTPTKVDDCFDWSKSALKENEIIINILTS